MATLTLGSLRIAFEDLADGRVKPLMAFVDEGLLETSDVKLFLGGFPLSLLFNGGYYYLHVIRESSSSDSGQQYSLGERYAALDGEAGNLFFAMTEVTRDNAPVEPALVWRAIPLAATEDHVLLVSEKVASSYDEEAELFLGGMPIKVRRIGNDWYLVVSG